MHRLISVQPADVLADRGVQPGEVHDSARFARNLCPSQGATNVFVEPILPRPTAPACGGSPVAAAAADLLRRFGFAVTVAAAEQAGFTEPGARLIGYGALAPARLAVVATQGRGGEAALRAVLASSDGMPPSWVCGAKRTRCEAPCPARASTRDGWRGCMPPPASISAP